VKSFTRGRINQTSARFLAGVLLGKTVPVSILSRLKMGDFYRTESPVGFLLTANFAVHFTGYRQTGYVLCLSRSIIVLKTQLQDGCYSLPSATAAAVSVKALL